MKPVTQSKVGAHGRCFPACVASILEVPEASVPGYEDSPDVYQWLAKRGLEYRQVPIEDRPAPVGYHIIEGISPRGGQHAVVGLNGKIVHDPHPQDNTGRGLVKPERWGMLLPLRGRAKDEDKVAYVIYRPPGSNAGVVEVNGQKYYIDATHRLVDAGYKLDNAKRLSTNDFGKKSTGEVQRWMRGYPVHPLSGEKAKDSMLSGLALQAAITPVYTRHNEIKATPRRSWQEVSRLLGETKALLDASRISDKAKWQTVLAHASSFLAMARDAERQGDNPHFVGWTERAFMMTHHVLDVLESLARRTTARDEDKPWGNWTAEELKLHNKVLRAFPGSPRQKELKRQLEELRAKNPAVRKAKDTHWEPGGDIKRLWLEANAPYGPGDLIKLPNGKITEVTKCLLGKNLFHEPEYHVSTKTGECVVVPVKTKAKDLALPDDDEGAIYTCITKDGVKHEIEAFTAKHANSIAEKRYGYANISVCPQESLKKRATDSPRKAPARLHRALDAVMDRVKAKDEERKIARWESKTGKYWVDLYFNPAFKLANGQTVVDAHYRGDSSGGGIQASTEAEAITAMQQRIDRGGFQPDASKTPMRRVK